jgi:hypothetical protein
VDCITAFKFLEILCVAIDRDNVISAIGEFLKLQFRGRGTE